MDLTDSRLRRRVVLQGLGACLVAAIAPCGARAGERAIERLIAQAQGYPTISERIELISQALLRRRSQAYTMIGGPRKAEVLVTRDDRFDCVTFCETVLAAARAQDVQSFETMLRAIRYRDGIVEWRERNHDFAAWCERNVAAGVLRPVPLGDPIEIRKMLVTPRALGRRSYSFAAAPGQAVLTEKDKLKRGDVIGFVSRRSWLDYFHTGFVTFDAKGDLLLRDASQSRGRVVDQSMKRFLAVNRVRYVTVLRPQETEKVA